MVRSRTRSNFTAPAPVGTKRGPAPALQPWWVPVPYIGRQFEIAAPGGPVTIRDLRFLAHLRVEEISDFHRAEEFEGPAGQFQLPGKVKNGRYLHHK